MSSTFFNLRNTVTHDQLTTLCHSRGAGTVFAELASTDDREQFRNTRPERREQGAHGDNRDDRGVDSKRF